MLSELIKRKIEQKLGQSIRYSKDCDVLAANIYSVCKCRVSASTLRRLMGFIKGNSNPRQHSLDVLSNYLGYQSYDELLNSFAPATKDAEAQITELDVKKIKKGDKYILEFKPDKGISILYIGKSEFKVISSKNSVLLTEDIFKVFQINLHHPLFILQVVRGGEQIGKLIEAKISGITSIRKL
jgi:hypothetical protein